MTDWMNSSPDFKGAINNISIISINQLYYKCQRAHSVSVDGNCTGLLHHVKWSDVCDMPHSPQSSIIHNLPIGTLFKLQRFPITPFAYQSLCCPKSVSLPDDSASPSRQHSPEGSDRQV